MTNDSEQTFEDLAKMCPELMEKSRIGESMGVGEGWFTIVSVLCQTIYEPVRQARYRLQAAIEYPRDDAGAYLAECEKEVADALEALPEIVQVKEKFGTLRFYYYGGDDRVSALVDFAEAMSGVTCEECGAPGTQTGGGWIKTLCAEHRRKSAPDEDQEDIEEGTISAKIEDDDPASW
jgi:hypothetical protein